MSTDGLPSVRTGPRARRALLSITVAAVAVPALLAPTPAAFAEDREAGEETSSPGPPMSAIGGELLSRPGTQVSPQRGAPRLPDDLTARSWIVADAESGDVLAAHNAHLPLAPASTVKMLFADTLLPKFGKDEVYTAEPDHFSDMGPGSSAVGIADHQTYTVDDLWHGVFLASGNDAVYALTAMNGGKEKTVREMNERARELQARDTVVVNPDGYDGEGQVSSAYDLTLIARSGMQKPDFRTYAATPRTDFPAPGKGKKRPVFEVQSTNRLLVGARGLDRYEGLAGIKNGYTSTAGYTFTGVAERGDRVLLVTVMKPADGDGLAVYRETAQLLDWGFEAADRVEPVGELVPPLSELPEGGADSTPESEEAALDGAAGPPAGERSAGGSAALGATALGLALLALATYLVPHKGWRGRRRGRRPLPR